MAPRGYLQRGIGKLAKQYLKKVAGSTLPRTLKGPDRYSTEVVLQDYNGANGRADGSTSSNNRASAPA